MPDGSTRSWDGAKWIAATFTPSPSPVIWISGTGAPVAVLAKGSMYSRTDGGVGSTLYVTQGGGVWNAVAGV